MSISKVVDGLEFVLPVDSAVGAENARITLTELARKLGYNDKSMLRRLADRHASELSEFGDTVTVTVSVKCGLFDRNVEEPTYNVEQAAYLALSSETPIGRASRVAIIKAHKALLEGYRQSQPIMTQAELIAASANLLVSIERSQAEHERRLANIESDNLRASKEAEAVGALPEAPVEASDRTFGQMTQSLITSFARSHNGEYITTYRTFYQAVEERPETRMDLRARLENAKSKVTGKNKPRLCDIIDASGKSAEIYAIARQLFAKMVAA